MNVCRIAQLLMTMLLLTTRATCDDKTDKIATADLTKRVIQKSSNVAQSPEGRLFVLSTSKKLKAIADAWDSTAQQYVNSAVDSIASTLQTYAPSVFNFFGLSNLVPEEQTVGAVQSNKVFESDVPQFQYFPPDPIPKGPNNINVYMPPVEKTNSIPPALPKGYIYNQPFGKLVSPIGPEIRPPPPYPAVDASASASSSGSIQFLPHESDGPLVGAKGAGAYGLDGNKNYLYEENNFYAQPRNIKESVEPASAASDSHPISKLVNIDPSTVHLSINDGKPLPLEELAKRKLQEAASGSGKVSGPSLPLRSRRYTNLDEFSLYSALGGSKHEKLVIVCPKTAFELLLCMSDQFLDGYFVQPLIFLKEWVANPRLT